MIALTFVAGSNLLFATTTGGVWHEAQTYGFCLGILGGALILQAHGSRLRSALGYTMLALATGCRPFYALYVPLLMILENRQMGVSLREVILRVTLGAGPIFAALCGYNYVRFGNVLEFGHKYLPWSQQLQDGIFSFAYFKRNFYHSFIKLPYINENGILTFDLRATAFWINNLIFVWALIAFFNCRMKKISRVALVGTLSVIWFFLLMHESNGWTQFGYRYLLDLYPITFLALLFRSQISRREEYAVALILVYSIAVNLYGIWWYGIGLKG